MDRRLIIPVVMAVVAAAAPARAQLQPAAVRVPAWSQTQLGVGAIGGTASNDLLLVAPGANSSLAWYPDGDLWTRGRPVPYAPPGVLTSNATLGSFDGGAAPDLVWEVDTTILAIRTGFHVAWGSSPGSYEIFPDAYYKYISHGLASLRLLPRPEPLIVATDGQVGGQSGLSVLDLKGARGTGVLAAPRSYTATRSFPSARDDEPEKDRVYALRASPAAVNLGVSDGAIPLVRGFRLLWNRTAAGATTLAGLAADYVDIGDPNILNPFPAALLEPGLTLQPGSTCYGVAGLDVDGDGLPDLVFTMRESPGKLLWLRNTTTSPGGLTTGIWRSLMALPELQPIQDPRVLRQVELAGGAAVALHDVALDQILLISGSGLTGFAVQRLPAFGGLVKELWTADVLGTSAPELLAWVKAPGGRDEVWVYPDDAAPAASYLTWAPGTPVTAPLGTDLGFAVTATAPGGLAAIVSTTPASSAVTVATFTVPGSALCDSALPVEVLARASIVRPGDDLGMLEQIRTSVSLESVPTLRMAGAGAPDGLVLAPGGTTARSEGAAWPACQTATKPSYTWSELALPGLATVAEQGAGSATAWRDFTVPESAYPILLSGAQTPALTLTASGPTTTSGNVSGTGSLPLRLDARSLVAASVAFDEAALAAGEVGTARITLASRLGVALTGVRAEVKLAGLALAGKPDVDGAHEAGLSGTTLIIDSLPASPATVELEVAVRSLGAPGGISVELFSEGGHRLSPEASPAADAPRLPGCGCGQGGGAEGWPIALLLFFLGSSPLPHRGRARADLAT